MHPRQGDPCWEAPALEGSQAWTWGLGPRGGGGSDEVFGAVVSVAGSLLNVTDWAVSYGDWSAAPAGRVVTFPEEATDKGVAMIIYIDRSRVETDWQCRRRRWWLTEWGAEQPGAVGGLVPSQEPFYYYLGTVVHGGMEGLLQGRDPQAMGLWAREAMGRWAFDTPEEAEQQACLVQGLVLGYARAVLPGLLQRYEVVATEQELTIKLEEGPDTFVWMVRPDALLRDRQSGALVYLEFKTTGSTSPGWLAQWATKPQLWLGPWALERTYGEPVEQTLVQGLYKGYNYKGEWRSPLVTAFQGAPVVRGVGQMGQAQWTHEYKRGWDRRPASAYPGGMEAWAAHLPMEVLQAQFPRPAPVFTNQPLFEAFLRQTQQREREIVWARGKPEAVREALFPQNFGGCVPAFGSSCAYERACWMPQVGKDPLGSGYFGKREPHHTQEGS